jgi:hypothetical protein
LSFHFVNKNLVLFKFRIVIILLTLYAHTHTCFVLEVNFNFSVPLEDSVQSTSQRNRIPCSRLDDVIYRPNAQLSKASSIRMMRTFRPDLPLCGEASNCSNLHPSGRFSSTSGRLSVFDKLHDFFPKHSYEKFAVAVRAMWIPVRTMLIHP